jgi:hypothetical protein
MANPFPFVAGDVLTAAELNGIGEKTAYTPTFTNLTLGNGTLTADFYRVQNVVTVAVNVVFGSTTSISGDVSVTLPIARAAAGGLQLATVFLGDTGFANYVGVIIFTATLGSVTVRNMVPDVTRTQSLPLSATAPFTWATTDVLRFTAQYEVA